MNGDEVRNNGAPVLHQKVCSTYHSGVFSRQMRLNDSPSRWHDNPFNLDCIVETNFGVTQLTLLQVQLCHVLSQFQHDIHLVFRKQFGISVDIVFCDLVLL